MQWPGQGIHSLSASFPWEGSLTEPGARVAASKPQWYLRHLSPQCRSYRHMQPCLGFYVGTGDLNLGPHNSPASVLTHWAWVQDFIHTTCAALSQNCRIVYKYIDKVIHGLYFPLFTFDIILPKLFCMSPTYTWKYFVEPKQGRVLRECSHIFKYSNAGFVSDSNGTTVSPQKDWSTLSVPGLEAHLLLSD